MKKILLLAVTLLSAMLLPAQGVYQLWGLAAGGGDNESGVLFRWSPASNTYSKMYSFRDTNGTTPLELLTYNNGKLYGMTMRGGLHRSGVIFEYNPATGSYTKKLDFDSNNGSIPYANGLTFNAGKLYGVTFAGGIYNAGVIFEWNLFTNVFSKRIDFNGSQISYPVGKLLFDNGNLYGMCRSGGQNGGGGIFEWNPSTNVFTKKIDFGSPDGGTPYGSLAAYNGKFYGMTLGGGINGAGIIFEWNPSTNAFTKKFDFGAINGERPWGSLTLYQGKLYGMTQGGGINDKGVIFEWNPLTDIFTKKFDFDAPDFLAIPQNRGLAPMGNLTFSGEKFFGTTIGGGQNGAGVIFEWDPATNVYEKKFDFSMVDGYESLELTNVPAPVAQGLPGGCTTLPPVTINNSNNNKWVPITDNDGNAVAEIKANGNNIGVVTVSMYINNTAVREDAAKKLYLDRNITIVSQVTPATPVDIRLYIKGSEYVALRNAVNSNGQHSGISSINDVGIYKISSTCTEAVATLINPVVSSAGAWETDYVFSARINSFSSFYFARKDSCVAPAITQIRTNPASLWPPNHKMKNVTVTYNVAGNCGVVSSSLSVSSNEPINGTGNGDMSPDWIVLDNHHLQLRAERAGSGNGRVYCITITTNDAFGNSTRKTTTVTVPHNQGSTHSKGFKNKDAGYVDANGDYFDIWFGCSVTPNPSRESFDLRVETASFEKIEAVILDISGRMIKKLNAVKNQSIRFGDELKPGVYLVKITQGKQQKTIMVVKQ